MRPTSDESADHDIGYDRYANDAVAAADVSVSNRERPGSSIPPFLTARLSSPGCLRPVPPNSLSTSGRTVSRRSAEELKKEIQRLEHEIRKLSADSDEKGKDSKFLVGTDQQLSADVCRNGPVSRHPSEAVSWTQASPSRSHPGGVTDVAGENQDSELDFSVQLHPAVASHGNLGSTPEVTVRAKQNKPEVSENKVKEEGSVRPAARKVPPTIKPPRF